MAELARIQERETELNRRESKLAREKSEIESKEQTVQQIVKVQVESIIAQYEATNSAEKERTILARQQAESTLARVQNQEQGLTSC